MEKQGYTGVWLQSTTVKGIAYVRVICGSYEGRANAEKVQKELEAKNYSGVWIDAIDK